MRISITETGSDRLRNYAANLQEEIPMSDLYYSVGAGQKLSIQKVAWCRGMEEIESAVTLTKTLFNEISMIIMRLCRN